MPDPGTALVVVDVMNTFRHEDGDELLRRMADRAPFIAHAIDRARRRGWPVVYVNDDLAGDGDPDAAVRAALAGPGGPLLHPLAPRPGDPLVLKPGRSGFDGTDLGDVLRGLGIDRVVVIGAVAEMCVRDTALDAVREGYAAAVLRGAAVPLAGSEEAAALEALDDAGVRIAEDAGF